MALSVSLAPRHSFWLDLEIMCTRSPYFMLVLAGLLIFSLSSWAAAPDYSSELVAISGGMFSMGSENGDADERPIHTVTVKSFQMARTEVTIGWYLRCMADGACSEPSWWKKGYFEESNDTLHTNQRMNLPITGISWQQAFAFCQWLGPEYTLPTEAEWEYAAGGASHWIYPWGNDAKLDPVPNRLYEKLTPVATHKALSFGLYDMEGHVWEWALDCYDALGPGNTCERRVAKGGSWSEHVWNLRVANKSFGSSDDGYKGLGFRVVRHVP